MDIIGALSLAAILFVLLVHCVITERERGWKEKGGNENVD